MKTNDEPIEETVEEALRRQLGNPEPVGGWAMKRAHERAITEFELSLITICREEGLKQVPESFYKARDRALRDQELRTTK